jgi:DNA sulfur modification protein DndE
MRRVLCLLLAGVGFIAAANNGAAADQKPLTEDEVFQLGVDAYIYGYALLVMDSVRAVSTNVAVTQDRLAPTGQFAHFRSFPDASTRDYAGLNLDTLYSTAWLDLSRGPYVLHLPDVSRRFYMMPILDGWTEVVGNPGTRTTGDKAGDYAITGPEWKGTLPAGVKHVKSGTNMVWLVGRTYSTGTAKDLAAARAIQDQYRLTPLALFGKPRAQPERGVVDSTIDMKTPPRDQIDRLDAATFFKRLAVLMKANPPAPQDAPMVAKLARLGIAGDFDPSKLPAGAAPALSRVPETARKMMLQQYATQKHANGWMMTTGSGHYGTDYLQRALVAYVGVGGNLPADAFYPIGRFDADGKPLTGASRYVVHFTKANLPPIDPRGFWSLTMYDKEYFLVPNPLNRHALSSRDKFKRNPDGSMDLYVQKESPGADRQGNWLPAPDGEFILMLRLYWPKDEAVNGGWAPPAVRRVGGTQ